MISRAGSGSADDVTCKDNSPWWKVVGVSLGYDYDAVRGKTRPLGRWTRVVTRSLANVLVLLLAQNAPKLRWALGERAIIPLPRRITSPQQWRGKGIPRQRTTKYV